MVDEAPIRQPEAIDEGSEESARDEGRIRRREAIRFAVVFLGLSLGLLLLLSGPLAERIQRPLCERVARDTYRLLRLLGENVSITGTVISSLRHSFRVVYACTSIPVTVLFVSAVLAFPAAAWRKTAGLLAGVLILYLVNLLRLVVLYYVHIHRPDLYERIHLTVWQSVLVVVAVVLFLAWTRFARRRSGP